MAVDPLVSRRQAVMSVLTPNTQPAFYNPIKPLVGAAKRAYKWGTSPVDGGDPLIGGSSYQPKKPPPPPKPKAEAPRRGPH